MSSKSDNRSQIRHVKARGPSRFEISSSIAARALMAIILCAGFGCSRERPTGTVEPQSSAPQVEPTGSATRGATVKASYYGEGDGLAGRRTASGERLNPADLTAAHRTLPFGTKLEVKNPKTGKKVQVRVNDRGPFVKGRSLDLSPAAATELGLKGKGVAPVEMTVVGKRPTRGSKPAPSAEIAPESPITPVDQKIEAKGVEREETGTKD